MMPLLSDFDLPNSCSRIVYRCSRCRPEALYDAAVIGHENNTQAQINNLFSLPTMLSAEASKQIQQDNMTNDKYLVTSKPKPTIQKERTSPNN